MTFTMNDLIRENCVRCGIPFCMTRALVTQRMKDHGVFNCPNGHAQSYTVRLTAVPPYLEQADLQSGYWVKAVCAVCAIEFGVSKSLAVQRKEDDKTLCCPNGHRLHASDNGLAQQRQVPPPPPPEAKVSPRIGDAARDAAMTRLTTAFAEGVLTYEEFTERNDSLWAAKTQADVDKLLKDLPAALAGKPRERGKPGNSVLTAFYATIPVLIGVGLLILFAMLLMVLNGAIR